MCWLMKVHFYFRDGIEHIIDYLLYIYHVYIYYIPVCIYIFIIFITNGESVFNFVLLKGYEITQSVHEFTLD